MSEFKSIELEDPKQQRFQYWEWIAERIGWGLFAGIVLAGLLGLLGPGMLSHRVVSSSDGRLTVDYYSIQRNEAPAELLIGFEHPGADQDRVRLAISRALTDSVSIDSITPEPDTVEMQPDRLVYTFLASGPAQRRKIVLRFENHQMGKLRYDIALEGGPSVSLSHFVCP